MPVLVLALLTVVPVEIVVPEVRALSGATADQGVLVGEEIARGLPASAFKVTTQAQLMTVLGVERQRQLLGCAEDASSCSAELASALGSEVVLQSTLARMEGGNMQCSVVFLSGRQGTALDRINAQGANFGELLERLHEEVLAAAGRILTRLRPGTSLEPGRPGVRRFAWIPALSGAALAGVGAGLFVATNNTWGTLNSRTGSVSDPQALATSGRTTEGLAWAACGVGAAALLASAAMFIFGAPVEPKVMVTPIAANSGAGLLLSLVLP